MQFNQEPIPAETSERSVGIYGPETPFRHWDVVRRYIKGLVERRGYEDLVSYNTTVERVEKIGSEWKVTLRREGNERDYWWVEWFDAVVVASGHYSVPYIPAIDGLDELEKSRPGSVIHSKHFRGRDLYKGKVSAPFKQCQIFQLTHQSEWLLWERQYLLLILPSTWPTWLNNLFMPSRSGIHSMAILEARPSTILTSKAIPQSRTSRAVLSTWQTEARSKTLITLSLELATVGLSLSCLPYQFETTESQAYISTSCGMMIQHCSSSEQCKQD